MGRALIVDSGVGGLSVLAEIRKASPDLRFTYVADNEFFPYGNRSEPELLERLPGLVARLCEHHAPNVVVVACNTASTVALDAIRSAIDIPVVGTVPAIKPAALKTATGVIGLLGTPGTVERQYTEELIHEYAPDVHVIRHGSSQLVELVEQKLRGQQLNFTDLKKIISNLTNDRRGHEMDTLVLACTHFPLIKDEIVHLLSPDIAIIDSGEAIARRTINRLSLSGSARADGETGDNVAIFTSQEEGLEALEPALAGHGIARVDYFSL